MRPRLLSLVLSGLLLAAPVGQAAPTCQDPSGRTLRCGTPGALPVGQIVAQADGPQPVPLRTLLDLVAVLGGLFAIIALMPDFDGQWDRQEEDDEHRP